MLQSIKSSFIYLLILALIVGQTTKAQSQDTTAKMTHFTGTLGITNNGFSIIPSFSFNSPAITSQLSWRGKKLSIDPDFRVAPNGKKGSLLLWFRYYPITGKKISLRVGAHPAVNWFPRQTTQNGVPMEIYPLRRFLAWELFPSYKVKNNIDLGLYYLQGNGLQDDGAQTTHFVNLNLTLSQLKISNTLRFRFTPAFYYLYVDHTEGTYFTATGTLSHTKLPFSIQSNINKTIRTNISGNKDFLWNVAFQYQFKKVIR